MELHLTVACIPALDYYFISFLVNIYLNFIFKNRAVNSILSVYARKAESQGIATEIDVRVPEELVIRDIDWVAILAFCTYSLIKNV